MAVYIVIVLFDTRYIVHLLVRVNATIIIVDASVIMYR